MRSLRFVLTCSAITGVIAAGCADPARVLDTRMPISASAVGAPFPRTVIERENTVSATATYVKRDGCILSALSALIIGNNDQSALADLFVVVSAAEFNSCTLLYNYWVQYQGAPPATLRAEISPSLRGAELVGSITLTNRVTGASEVAHVAFRWIPDGPPTTVNDRDLDVILPWMGFVFWGAERAQPVTNTAWLSTPTRVITAADFDQIQSVSLVKTRRQTLSLHIPN